MSGEQTKNFQSDGGDTWTINGSLVIGQDAVVTGLAGGAPSGTAGGDLAGTYPNPTVKGMHGTALSVPVTAGAITSNSGAAAWTHTGTFSASGNITAGGEIAASNGLRSAASLISALPTPTSAAAGRLRTVSNGVAYATAAYGADVVAAGVGTVTRIVMCGSADQSTFKWFYN